MDLIISCPFTTAEFTLSYARLCKPRNAFLILWDPCTLLIASDFPKFCDVYLKRSLTRQLVWVAIPREIIHTLCSTYAMCINSVWHCTIMYSTRCVYAPQVVVCLHISSWYVVPPPPLCCGYVKAPYNVYTGFFFPLLTTPNSSYSGSSYALYAGFFFLNSIFFVAFSSSSML